MKDDNGCDDDNCGALRVLVGTVHDDGDSDNDNSDGRWCTVL